MAVLGGSVRQFQPSWRSAAKGEHVKVGEEVTRAPLSIGELLATDEARSLVEAGTAAGTLNIDEISGALDELELEVGVMDDFYGALDELQIEVVGATSWSHRTTTSRRSRPCARCRRTRSSCS